MKNNVLQELPKMTTKEVWTKNYSIRIDEWNNEGTLINNIAEVDTIDCETNESKALQQAVVELVDKYGSEVMELYLKNLKEIEDN